MCLPTVSSHTSSAHLRSRKGREKEERKWKEDKEERRRTGFHQKNVARSMETLQGDWWTWPIASFAALSRILALLRFFRCELESYTIIGECSRVVKKKQNHNMSFRDLSRSNFTFAVATQLKTIY
jgi:hypothetical protein